MNKVLKLAINSKRINQIKVFGLFAVYPTLFMFPALFSGNKVLARDSYSDVRHYVWMAQQLRNMKLPWSHNLMFDAPTGASFWNPAAFVNGAYWMFIWLLTRVASPLASVNISILAGWVLSGVSGYVLAKRLGSNSQGAIFAGLILQMLPWMREKVLTHPLYVFWCIPICILILTLDFIEKSDFRHFVLLSLGLIFSFFTDLYWFWFAIDLAVIVILLNISLILKAVSKWSICQKCLTATVTISFPLTVFLAYGSVQRKTSESITWERPLTVASANFVDQLQSQFWQFLTPPPEHLIFANQMLFGEGREDKVGYIGFSVVLLAIYGVLKKEKLKRLRFQRSVWATVVVFALFTLPTTFSFLGVRIGFLSDSLRYLNPGLRFYSRTGMISQACLCVLAGCGISKLSDRISRQRVLAVILLLVLAVDLNPFSRRLVDDDYVQYSKIREALHSFDSPVTLEIPPDTNRLYFPRNYIDSPKAFTWAEFIDRSNEVRLQASRGDVNFYSYLVSRGVTHILVPSEEESENIYRSKWGLIGAIKLSLDDRYFKISAHADGRYPATLVELKNSKQSSYCSACVPYSIGWSGTHFGFAGTLFDEKMNSGSYVDGVNLSWVLSGESPSFQISSQDGKARTYEVVISMVPAFGPQARPQVVGVTTKTGISTHQLSAGKVTEVALVVKSGDSVVLKSYLPCVVPSAIDPGNTDQRELCYGVTDFTVKEIFP